MPLPSNRLAYADMYDIFDRALADPKGIRMPFDSENECHYYRMRCNTARAVDRTANMQIYPKGHNLHGQSIYDVLYFRIRKGEDGSYFVYLEPKSKFANEDMVENLSEIEIDDEEVANGQQSS